MLEKVFSWVMFLILIVLSCIMTVIQKGLRLLPIVNLMKILMTYLLGLFHLVSNNWSVPIKMNLFHLIMLIFHLQICVSLFIFLIGVPIFSNNKDSHFGLQLWDDDLYDRVYIEEIKDKSTVDKAFNKSTFQELKCSFITHIESVPVFNTKETSKKLEELYAEYLKQGQGMIGKKKKFLFSVTFGPEKKLLGNKLKKAFDEYTGYTPGTTKIIKSKSEESPDMADVDDDSTRFLVGTKVFKVFNDIEYKGAVTGYDHKKRFNHIIYEDGDAEDYYHNEV